MNTREQMQQRVNHWIDNILRLEQEIESFGWQTKEGLIKHNLLSEYKGKIYATREFAEILGIELDTSWIEKRQEREAAATQTANTIDVPLDEVARLFHDMFAPYARYFDNLRYNLFHDFEEEQVKGEIERFCRLFGFDFDDVLEAWRNRDEVSMLEALETIIEQTN